MQNQFTKYLSFSILPVQIVLLFIGFNKFFIHPNEFLLNNVFDGLKNYFTYHTFLREDLKDVYFKYNNMNYPYGEYVFYTDATPLLSVPLKFISKNIIDLSNHTFLIYNLFFILGILLTTLLTYKILRFFIENIYLLFILSISLPWINPQITRFMPGHCNLSLAWIILLGIYLLLKIWSSYQEEKENTFKLFLYASLLSLHIILSSFIHLYYLPIVGLMVLFFMGFWGLTHYQKPLRGLKIVGLSLGIVGIAFVVVITLIKGIDSYYVLRKVKAEGYDWENWKLTFSALFTHYDWNSLRFPVAYNKKINYESYAYLGGFALYGLLGIGLMKLFFKEQAISLKAIFREQKQGKLLFILGLMALFCLLVSLGEVYYFLDNTYYFYNYLNPLYIGKKIVPRLAQFRCLGRFSWPFFWIFNIIIAIIIDHYWKKSKLKKEGKTPNINYFIQIFIAGLFILSIADTHDFVKKMNRHYFVNSLVEIETTSEIRNLAKDIDFQDYQAILPIPFYHVGSENYEYTIDPQDKFCTQTYQLSIESKLPLMSSKMSRTAVNQAKELMGIFLEGKASENLKMKLNNKPILVIFNADLFGDDIKRPASETAKRAYNNGQDLVKDLNMELLVEKDYLSLYKWIP